MYLLSCKNVASLVAGEVEQILLCSLNISILSHTCLTVIALRLMMQSMIQNTIPIGNINDQ